VHSFDASDVGSLYPQWRSTEEITKEGEDMAKRTRQLFQEAKRAQVMDELTRSGTTPPDMIEQIAGQGDLLGLDGDEMSAAASEATSEHPEDECDIKPQEAASCCRRRCQF